MIEKCRGGGDGRGLAAENPSAERGGGNARAFEQAGLRLGKAALASDQVRERGGFCRQKPVERAGRALIKKQGGFAPLHLAGGLPQGQKSAYRGEGAAAALFCGFICNLLEPGELSFHVLGLWARDAEFGQQKADFRDAELGRLLDDPVRLVPLWPGLKQAEPDRGFRKAGPDLRKRAGDHAWGAGGDCRVRLFSAAVAEGQRVPLPHPERFLNMGGVFPGEDGGAFKPLDEKSRHFVCFPLFRRRNRRARIKPRTSLCLRAPLWGKGPPPGAPFPRRRAARR